MKATEVLNRYANGERDFRRANLRGQSFKGQELSGADFTEADIRGANFTNAVLKEANFAGARAGLQKQWLIALLGTSLLLAVMSGAISAIVGSVIGTALLGKDQAFTSAGILSIMLNITFIAVTVIQGLEASSTVVLATVAVAGVVAVTASVVLSFKLAIAGVGAVAGAGAVASADAIAGAVIFTTADIITNNRTCAFFRLTAIASATAIATSFAYSSSFPFEQSLALVLAIALPTNLLSIYIAWCVSKNDKKYALVQIFAVGLAATGGTNFCGASLIKANFTQATLKSTNFKEASLDHICWVYAKNLDHARVGNSILADANVRDLLITHNGNNKRYIDANLRGANLDGVNLNQADLKWADLSGATLHRAEFKDANLREVLAIGTDFTAAHLTGACLEAWNIDRTTKLDHVDCQYVFLLEHPNVDGHRERRPHDPDKHFKPGDFEKYFQDVLDTIQILIRKGATVEDLQAAFQRIVQDYDIPPKVIGWELKGEDALLTIQAPPGINKGDVERDFDQVIEARIEAAKTAGLLEGLQRQAESLEKTNLALIQTLPHLVPKSLSAIAMNDNTDRSQNINIGGNVTGETLNLGAISGNVSNIINQLPSAPDPAQPGIKELLIELQAAIESDADLPEKGKASALENVKVLAEVAQDPEQPEKKGLGSQAITFLKGAASFLPDTAKLAEASTKLLPLITKALGLPF